MLYISILLYGSKVNIIANLIIQIIYILVFYDFLFTLNRLSGLSGDIRSTLGMLKNMPDNISVSPPSRTQHQDT